MRVGANPSADPIRWYGGFLKNTYQKAVPDLESLKRGLFDPEAPLSDKIAVALLGTGKAGGFKKPPWKLTYGQRQLMRQLGDKLDPPQPGVSPFANELPIPPEAFGHRFPGPPADAFDKDLIMAEKDIRDLARVMGYSSGNPRYDLFMLEGKGYRDYGRWDSHLPDWVTHPKTSVVPRSWDQTGTDVEDSNLIQLILKMTGQKTPVQIPKPSLFDAAGWWVRHKLGPKPPWDKPGWQNRRMN